MSHSRTSVDTDVLGSLKHSRRCYHWLFVWVAINLTLAVGISIRGFAPAGLWTFLAVTTVGLGYAFLMDISDRVWWTPDQVWWRGWEYFSIRPMHHKVRVAELTNVMSGNHAANWMPGRPFDRIELVSPADAITILPSFHRREELEELLRFIYSTRADAFVDPQVIEFMNGGFTDWWRYR